MLQNKKIPAAGLLLAGAAAFAYYKYSQMSETEKANLVNDLKEKGKKLFDQYMPEIKNMFANATGNTQSGFGAESSHSG